MKFSKWLMLGVAIVIISLEAFLFTRASTDVPDIGVPSSTATPAATDTTASAGQLAASFASTPGETR